jgi:hypothetical protein
LVLCCCTKIWKIIGIEEICNRFINRSLLDLLN